MIEVNSCVICGNGTHRLKKALVAPFLATRIWDKDPFCVDLVECRACGFRFYNPRLDAAEEVRLYSGYRSEDYQRMRQASEPWYTPEFNASLASTGSYQARRAKLAPILRQHIGQRKISRVLDYGGDRGDLVAGLLEGAEAFVYDISGVRAAAGVTATSDPAGCKADLIVNSNVLEHVGFPRVLMGEIRQAAPEGGLVFIEAPCEFPFGLARISRRLAQIGIMALTRPGRARFVARPASLYMMHEHINYLTEKTLVAPMGSSGFSVNVSGSYFSAGRAGKADMAWCLGTAT
ncbi:MAG: class I SAM-dependent methyltransferase [Terracidiphilus sp.]|jgi:Zn ribbon nucleic-acid-binding protein